MSQPESENCRYCLEPLDCELGDIFDPCKCKSKVHKNCFIHWLETRPLDPDDDEAAISKCEICNSNYKRRYSKYIRRIFNKRSFLSQITDIIYRDQNNVDNSINDRNSINRRNRRNRRNHDNYDNYRNDDSSYSCIIVWLGLFFTLMIIMAFDNNYDPNYYYNNTITYNSTN